MYIYYTLLYSISIYYMSIYPYYTPYIYIYTHSTLYYTILVFRFFDTNGSGTISRDEFRQGCELLNQSLPEESKIKEFDRLLSIMVCIYILFVCYIIVSVYIVKYMYISRSRLLVYMYVVYPWVVYF